MKKALLAFLLILSFAGTARASCDDPEAKRVLGFQAVDCPAGVGIAQGRAYAADGRRYRAVYIAYTDPDTGVSIYAQLVRGPRSNTPTRYDIDVCIYGSDGPLRPLFQQVGGDESVSVCCDHTDENDVDDGPCPEPPYYPLPMAAPPGQDVEQEEQARDKMVQLLTSPSYPWLRKWDPLRAALHASYLSPEQAASPAMRWITGSEADAARDRINGADGEVRFSDGTHFPAMRDADLPADPRAVGDDDGIKHWRQIVVVSKKTIGPSGPKDWLGRGEAYWCNFWHVACEHSAAFWLRRSPTSGWRYAGYRCNHGGCPVPDYPDYDPHMQAWCLHDNVYFNRWWHVHSRACANLYDPSGWIYGHLCNDDTELQYHAIRDNFHPNEHIAPCVDFVRHWTTTPCW